LKSTKKVLIITYYWPPAGGSGVQRWLKFSKYLGDFGWEPVVLTTENGSYPMLDVSLLEDVPIGLKVYRTKSFEILQLMSKFSKDKKTKASVGMIGLSDSKSLFSKFLKFVRANFILPDARKGWNKYAYKEAVKIIKSENIDLIVTTGPPHSSHLIGLQLKKKLNIKWIADFRDPWINIYYNRLLPRTRLAYLIDLNLETKVVTKADHVIVVSEGLKQDLSRHKADFTVIYNGYDDSDIHLEEKNDATGKFTLAHIGNFIPDYNCPAIWNALNEIEQEMPGFLNDFRLNFTGVVDQSAIKSIEAEGLKEYVLLNPYVPHKEATLLMSKSNLLLFVLPKDVNNKLIISGKIFEYMASGTPILSLGPPDGEAAYVLKKANRDLMLDYNDTEGIKNVILKYYKDWRKNRGRQFKHLGNDYKQFSRKELTRQLSEVLDRVQNS